MGSGQPHYHFGTQGQLQMGEAFANAYLRDIGQPLESADRRFKNALPIPKSARVRMFVLAGQRNTEGEDSYLAALPGIQGFESMGKDQDRVLYRYSLGGGLKKSSDWEPLGPVDFLGNFGPELSFGARLRKSLDANNGIAVLKFTHSGAQSPDWFPKGSPETHRNLYSKLIAFINEAKEDLNRRGFECSLEGIFWHTGENDTYFGPYAQNYAKSIKQVIDQSRLDLKQPELPWFISEQHKNAPWKNMDSVNAALNEMAGNDRQVTIIKTSHLPHERHHFGTQGTLLLGEEMANAYLKKP
jgi:hypothetical protein